MVILENEILYVEISEIGAEVRKVLCEGKNRAWTGDEKYWKGVSPVLFPICSRLREGYFTYEGEKYEMGMHGFAGKQEFQVEESSPISATFLLKDNEETLKQYPWHFEFRVTYTLRGNCLDTTYDIRNKSQSTMYYSVGAHESYWCENGIEDYDIIFERNETLYNVTYDDKSVPCTRHIMLKDSNVLPLYENYFNIDSIIFKDVKSRYATIRNRKTGESSSVKFDGFDYLLLWHKPGASYICFEPWAGICASNGGVTDITKKEGILKLEVGEKKIFNHSVYYQN